MRVRALGIAFLLCAAFGLAAAAQTPPAGELQTRDGAFIHVTHGAGQPHRLLMAFKMATLMAESGKPVLVYCDIDAVGVLTKEASDVTLDPFGSAKAQVRRMIELGVRVRACPTCLKIAGYTEADLMEGVKLANGDEFFNFTQGRILSVDY